MDDWRNLAIKLMEEERRRLARDIHDGPAQVLSLLTMRFDVLKKMIEHNPQMALAEVERVQASLRTSINELRRMIYDLKPLAFEENGWKEMLQHHAERFAEFHHIQVDFVYDDRIPKLPEEMEMGLYRLIQECTNNIAKHAMASHVSIHVSLEEGPLIRVEIEDNGHGFDLATVRAGSFGIQGMKERAALIGGRLDIQSAIGQGTKVVVTVPLQ